MNLLAASSSFPDFPTVSRYLREHPALEEWVHFLVFWEDILYSGLIAFLISAIFYFGTTKRELVPHGFQNFVEWIVENARNVIRGILGPDGDEHVPFLGTIFIYVFAMNIFGIIPFMKSPSSSFSISIGVALCVFARVQYLNVRNMGAGGYLYHLCGAPKNFVEWMIAPLMFPIEVMTQISRPITLALRLTGNVMGEHLLVTVAAFFAIAVFTFDWLPFGIPIQLPAMLFGLVTSLMQALVFTLLSTVYILLSDPHKAEKH